MREILEAALEKSFRARLTFVQRAGNVLTLPTEADVPASLIYVTATQLAATVPYSVAGTHTSSMQISSNGVTSVPVTLNVTDAVPGIFTVDASGKGQGAALNQDNTVNSAFNPATAGTAIALYGTGGGTLTADALPRLTLSKSATVGGMPATIEYAGIAPGLVQGVIQVNIRLPAGVTGPTVPVVVTIGDKSSPPVTVAVQ